MRWTWPVAVAAAVLTGALALSGVVLAAIEPTGATVTSAAVGAVGALWAALGVVVARHARRNPVGALLALAGAGVAFTEAREIAERVLVQHPATLRSLDWLAALLEESSIWLFV